MLAVAIFALVMGLCIGSFLNVVAYRLPRGESLNHPPSHCPHCDTPIKPWHNVPVFGWLWLRGRCASCQAPISPRYPIVEAVTGLLYVLVVVVKWDDAADIARGIALVTLLVPVTLIDLDVQLIPNKLTYPFGVLAIVLGLALDSSFVVEQLIAGAAGFAFFFVAAVLYPRGMGGGDVKLAGVLGLYLGRAVGPAILFALIAGIVVGGVVMSRKGVAEGRKTKIPFGPSLALGGLFGLLVGMSLADDYTSTF